MAEWEPVSQMLCLKNPCIFKHWTKNEVQKLNGSVCDTSSILLQNYICNLPELHNSMSQTKVNLLNFFFLNDNRRKNKITCQVSFWAKSLFFCYLLQFYFLILSHNIYAVHMEDTLRHRQAIEGHLHIWNTTYLPKTRNMTT